MKETNLMRTMHKRGVMLSATILGLGMLPSAMACAQVIGGMGGDTRQSSNNGSVNGGGDSSNGSNNSSSSSSDASQNPFTSLQTNQPRNLGDANSDSITQDELLRAQQNYMLRMQTGRNSMSAQEVKPPKPSEFEDYVEKLLGRKLPRFGSDLLARSEQSSQMIRDFNRPATATVPPDYVIQPGDKVVISLNGSVTGSVQRQVDTDGKIFLQGVGSIKVAGVRNADLRETIARAVGQQYNGYTVSVNVKEMHGVRVYVTGLAEHPGAFNVNNLTSLANAVLQAGGPAAGGSFRSVKLYRNGQQVADFDLYKLMRGGSRLGDVPLQNEDVLFIPPVGTQVAVIGSVNEEAIYEALPGESVADMLAAAGGPGTLADPSRVVLYHQNDADGQGPIQLNSGEAANVQVRQGDLIQMLSVGSLVTPTDHQRVLVRIEGEVRKPGIYYVDPGTSSGELMSLAGGLTANAYVFGAKFTRQSVQIQQQQAFREAIRQMEVMVAGTPLVSDTSVSADQKQQQLAAARDLIKHMADAKPDGRLVLDLSPSSSMLPSDMVLQNNDAVYIPRRENTVGIFGAVPRATSFMIDMQSPKRVRDYIERAGGTLRISDRSHTIVVRANGEVLSHHNHALDARVLPGDVVFVPARTQASTFWPKFKDIAQMLFGFGLTAAAIASLTQ